MEPGVLQGECEVLMSTKTGLRSVLAYIIYFCSIKCVSALTACCETWPFVSFMIFTSSEMDTYSVSQVKIERWGKIMTLKSTFIEQGHVVDTGHANHQGLHTHTHTHTLKHCSTVMRTVMLMCCLQCQYSFNQRSVLHLLSRLYCRGRESALIKKEGQWKNERRWETIMHWRGG